jgi:hypothetical protein
MSERHDSGCKSKFPLPPGVIGEAVFAGDADEHRLTLVRQYAEAPPDAPFALWCGMNPSGAEGDVDDLTIRKEWHWTRALGFRRYIKVNAASYRWTQSVELGALRASLVHPDNLPTIRSMAAGAAVIILAMGDPPDAIHGPARNVLRALKMDGRRARCLGVTRNGWPKHSSRLGYATPLVDYVL